MYYCSYKPNSRSYIKI